MKLASEGLAAAYRRCYGLPFAVVRFSNVYGRYDNDLERLERAIWVFRRQILAGRRLTVFGESKTLDFTYVDDAVDGLRLLPRAPRRRRSGRRRRDLQPGLRRGPPAGGGRRAHRPRPRPRAGGASGRRPPGRGHLVRRRHRQGPPAPWGTRLGCPSRRASTGRCVGPWKTSRARPRRSDRPSAPSGSVTRPSTCPSPAPGRSPAARAAWRRTSWCASPGSLRTGARSKGWAKPSPYAYYGELRGHGRRLPGSVLPPARRRSVRARRRPRRPRSAAEPQSRRPRRRRHRPARSGRQGARPAALAALGPRSPPRPLTSYTIGLDEPERMAAKARAAADFPIIKIKVGTGRDAERVRAVRDAVPEARLVVDANGAWTPEQAVRTIRELAPFGLGFVEQPVAGGDLEGLRYVRERSDVPLIADEFLRHRGRRPPTGRLRRRRERQADEVRWPPRRAAGDRGRPRPPPERDVRCA